MRKKNHNGADALVDLVGEIRAADLDNGTFVLRLADGTKLEACFTPAQEATITEALRQHASVRLHVKGRAESARKAGPKRVVSVESLRVEAAGEEPYDETAKPIWKVAEEIAAAVPDEEWQKLPTDLARNYKHYLYGAPKKK